MVAQLLLFLFAGLAGGVVNAAAGGAKLFVFPLLLASGLDPIAANATGTVALWPATLPAAWAYRRELGHDRRGLVLTLVPAIAGALCGALVLIASPEADFVAAIPLLLAIAVTAILLGRRLTVLAERYLPRRTIFGAAAALLFCVGFYGGYFGAGMGFMLVAVLSAAFGGDIHGANAKKNLFAFCINSTAAVPLLLSGNVNRVAAVAVLAGGLAGGYLGGRVLRRIPPWLLRITVAGLGVVLTASFLMRDIQFGGGTP